MTIDPTTASRDAVLAVLNRSQELGFLGPGPVDAQLEHALGFAGSGQLSEPGRFLDLGSGGGVPGLVVAALVWRSSSAVLLDATERRCAFLVEALAELALADRVTVHRARAEEAGRDPALRGAFDVVVARSFGRPAVTAECSAPFLATGGRLIVSEPPPPANGVGDKWPARWPAAGLETLGMVTGEAWATPFHYQAVVQERPCPDEFPRHVGVPAKRPLF